MQIKPDRIYYLDSMRSVLMTLGVVLHAAQVYNPRKEWLVYSETTSDIMMYAVSLIHVFRMPAFFVVSGFFCYMTLTRYPIKKFLTIRLKRLVIPFLTTAVTLNSVQAYVLDYSGWSPFDLAQYIINGGYVSHLWFLINLSIYFLLVTFVAVFFKKSFAFLGKIISRFFSALPFFIAMLFLPFVSVGINSLGKLGLPLYANILGFTDVFTLCAYLPYFVFGIIVSYKPELLSLLCSGKTSVQLLVSLTLAFLLLHFLPLGGLLLRVVEIYVSHLSSWTGTAVCFYIFHRFMNVVSDRVLFFSDASYTVYLFHHLLIVFLGLLLVHYGVSPLPGVSFLIVTVSATTLLIHKYCILRFPILRYLFNGK